MSTAWSPGIHDPAQSRMFCISLAARAVAGQTLPGRRTVNRWAPGNRIPAAQSEEHTPTPPQAAPD